MERGPETSKDINPATAFAIVAAILVVIGLTWFFVRPQPAEPVPAAPTSPDFSLTDEEAIARFKELDSLRNDALRSRDVSILGSVFSSEGPAYKRVAKSINKLKSQGVLFRSEYKPVSTTVLSNSGDEIQVKVVEEVDPKFTSEKGKDLTKGRPERHTTIWTLRRYLDHWLIYDGVLTNVEDV